MYVIQPVVIVNGFIISRDTVSSYNNVYVSFIHLLWGRDNALEIIIVKNTCDVFAKA